MKRIKNDSPFFDFFSLSISNFIHNPVNFAKKESRRRPFDYILLIFVLKGTLLGKKQIFVSFASGPPFSQFRVLWFSIHFSCPFHIIFLKKISCQPQQCFSQAAATRKRGWLSREMISSFARPFRNKKEIYSRRKSQKEMV